jgi:hypothetical protein
MPAPLPQESSSDAIDSEHAVQALNVVTYDGTFSVPGS